MDLASVPEIGPYASRLRDAGVGSAEELAALTDVADVSARSGIEAERLESFREAARAHVERVLAEAGVASEADLMSADTDALAARTGIPARFVASYQAVARESVRERLARAGVEGPTGMAAMGDMDRIAAETGIRVAELERMRDEARAQLAATTSAEPDKVVLLERAAVARVRVAGELHEAVPIVTARAGDDEADVLARAGPFAVLLKERAETAPVRIRGELHAGLPIFKEHAGAGGEAEEIRVRVAQIREIEEPKPGFLGRLRRKK